MIFIICEVLGCLKAISLAWRCNMEPALLGIRLSSACGKLPPYLSSPRIGVPNTLAQ
jgi:hypothetical protein